jgi:hypothetical protein
MQYNSYTVQLYSAGARSPRRICLRDRCCCSGSAGQRSLVYSSSDPARVLYTHPYCRLAHSASGAAARIRTVPDMLGPEGAMALGMAYSRRCALA